jgi:uncharacterized membrane protein (UPF0127 family)
MLTLRREDGRIVCEQVEVADSTLRRMRGLLGRRHLPAGTGITLRPAWSIHTAFMQFPIDVVFLDHDLVVLRITPALRSFRTASCRGAREVVELPAGECAHRGLTVGDRVAWASHTDTAFTGAGQDSHTPATPAGRVLIASRDARFVKLIGFLLDQRGIQPVTVTPESLQLSIESEEGIIAAVLDARDAVAEALTDANATRALRPEIPLLLVGETRASMRAPVGTRIFDKWNDTDELVTAIVTHLPTGADHAPGR